MSMITEQVERLRTLADIAKDIADNSNDTVKTLRESADTIEQLAAIKTLEQEPCPDAISRQTAIDYCYQLINVEHQQGSDEMNYGQERVNQTETILYYLEFMPSVWPEQKTGHWINGDCEGGNCSICGEYYAFYPESGDFNYCPNCGAKMVEPQEREG